MTDLNEPLCVRCRKPADRHNSGVGCTIFTLPDDPPAANELSARDRRTMTDTQRLIWRDDVEGICPTPDMCFEYGEHVRCGPCAIKQATACGVASDLSLPNLPEVSRQHREIAALRERVAALEAENDRLTKAVGSGILGQLLNDEETDEFVKFIKFLREQGKSNG